MKIKPALMTDLNCNGPTVINRPSAIAILLFYLLLQNLHLQAAVVKVFDKTTNNYIASIPTVQVGRYQFVSLKDWASDLRISFHIDENAKRVYINLDNRTIIIAAFNPFVMIDKQIRQMPVNVYYQNGDFLVPLKFFIEIINDVFDSGIEYDRSRSELIVTRSNANVIDLAIEPKANGTLIRVETTKEFDPSDIYTSVSQGWLLVDIFGGRIEPNWAPALSSKSIIKKIEPEQLSDQTARIAFKVSSDVKEVHTIPGGKAGEILITVRTKEDVSQEILQELERERDKWRLDCVVIDPGHGGKDPGTVGRGGIYEKKITLAIAKRLKNLLEKRLSVKVVMTRDNDNFVGLKDRTQFANKHNGKLFVSIHVDSYRNSRVGGCTTYFLGPAKNDEAREVARLENSVIQFEESPEDYSDYSDANFILIANAQNLFTKESQDLAAMVQNEMHKRLSIKARGVKQAGFYVLYGASMPCILHETAFISNRKEYNLLKSSSFQQKVAEGLCESIRQFKAKYEMGI